MALPPSLLGVRHARAFSISKPRPPACAPPGSAVFSMTKCTLCLESTTIPSKACITSPWAARSTMPGSPHFRRTSFNREAARCEDGGVSRFLQLACGFHCSPHRGLPHGMGKRREHDIETDANSHELALVGIHRVRNQAGKPISVPELTAITT